ncbi:hypothetical protein [Saccharopolyspora sp. 6V]|uniref:hypothetical protein n=1 Tax=Saccharopolyspora sp. 6V TaxID=2877239 RepID=UPI001CD5AC71|nr:hypothetical protein [Saccharopolyspora sp. 6V]MCA1191672.1 hypothetical protein [Saccharopolyspora sp. 6V]
MEKDTHTKPRQIRIPDADWQEFEEAAAQAGTTRSALVQDFVRWYLRREKAKLPRRPTPAAPQHPREESSTPQPEQK